MTRRNWMPGLILACAILLPAPAEAAFHTFDTSEVFSNADGTIQFVEMLEAQGFNSQHLFADRHLTTNANDFKFPGNLPSSLTAGRRVLLATVGFTALPGAPTPDFIIPDSFFDPAGDTISLRSGSTFPPVDSFTFSNVPTDGIQSLSRDGTTGINSPTNFAGQIGSIDVSAPPSPPAVPDGVAGAPMRVDKLNSTGTQIRISFDDTTCSDLQNHQIVFGGGSQLPTTFAGTYGLDGSVCAIGAISPFDWLSAPDPTFDAAGFVWWLILATDDGTTEGSWGGNSGELERNGLGSGGSSDQCGITTKDLANTCGQ